MTDVKRVLAQLADMATDSIMKQALLPPTPTGQTESLLIANQTLMAIREAAQDCLGVLMQETKQ